MNKAIQHAFLGALTGGAVDTAIGAGTAVSSREYKHMKSEDKKNLLSHSALVSGLAGAGVGLLEGPVHSLIKKGGLANLTGARLMNTLLNEPEQKKKKIHIPLVPVDPIGEIMHKFSSLSHLKKVIHHVNVKKDVEDAVGQLASNPPLFGNAAKKGFTAQDADPQELAIGMAVEAEHSSDPSIRRNVALDHMSEFPGQKYYTALLGMENALKKTAYQEKIAVSLGFIKLL